MPNDDPGANLHPALKSAVDCVLSKAPNASISSGFRTRQEQQALYDKYISGQGNLAAKPGTSQHEHGLAVDFGGDLEAVAAAAPECGLAATVPGEPWHFELGDPGAAGVDDDAYSNVSFDPATSLRPEDALANRLNTIVGIVGMDPLTEIPDIMDPPEQKFTTDEFFPDMEFPDRWADDFSGSGEDIDRFMAAMRAVESGGGQMGQANYSVVNSIGAAGAYQFMPDTWAGYGGYSSAHQAPPQVQDQRARELMSQYYSEFGDWSLVAVAWHGGLGAARKAQKSGKITGRDMNISTSDYVNKVLGLMYSGG